MRRFRRTVELALPIAGVVLVLGAVLLLPGSLMVQLGVVLAGLVLIEAGVWHLASPVLPSERKYVALRREVDGFILLVRRLNRATLALASDSSSANRAKLLEVRDEMLDSVRRMERVAGRTEEADHPVASDAASSAAAPRT